MEINDIITIKKDDRTCLWMKNALENIQARQMEKELKEKRINQNKDAYERFRLLINNTFGKRGSAE